VSECAAFAMPHEVLGEVVEVAIILHDHRISAEEVREHCRKTLASFKVPHAVHVLDQLPRTSTGKVRKDQIVGQIMAPAADPDLKHAPSLAKSHEEIAEAITRIVSAHMAASGSSRVGPTDVLFDLGLDSLRTIELIDDLERHFAVDIPPNLLYDRPT